MTTNIEQVQTALTEFSKVEAGLAALRQQYAGMVYDVTTTVASLWLFDMRAAV